MKPQALESKSSWKPNSTNNLKQREKGLPQATTSIASSNVHSQHPVQKQKAESSQPWGTMIGNVQRQAAATPNKLTQQSVGYGDKPVIQRVTNGKSSEPSQSLTTIGQSETRPTSNNTGLPDALQDGLESISGIDLSDVTVHYNTSKPSQIGAYAYAQGRDIYLGPGQERHLPHEAWHVVQQKQGRVSATAKARTNIPINNDARLEEEAEAMGEKIVKARPKRRRTQGAYQLGYEAKQPGIIQGVWVKDGNREKWDELDKYGLQWYKHTEGTYSYEVKKQYTNDITHKPFSKSAEQIQKELKENENKKMGLLGIIKLQQKTYIKIPYYINIKYDITKKTFQEINSELLSSKDLHNRISDDQIAGICAAMTALYHAGVLTPTEGTTGITGNAYEYLKTYQSSIDSMDQALGGLWGDHAPEDITKMLIYYVRGLKQKKENNIDYSKEAEQVYQGLVKRNYKEDIAEIRKRAKKEDPNEHVIIEAGKDKKPSKSIADAMMKTAPKQQTQNVKINKSLRWIGAIRSYYLVQNEITHRSGHQIGLRAYESVPTGVKNKNRRMMGEIYDQNSLSGLLVYDLGTGNDWLVKFAAKVGKYITEGYISNPMPAVPFTLGAVPLSAEQLKGQMYEVKFDRVPERMAYDIVDSEEKKEKTPPPNNEEQKETNEKRQSQQPRKYFNEGAALNENELAYAVQTFKDEEKNFMPYIESSADVYREISQWVLALSPEQLQKVALVVYGKNLEKWPKAIKDYVIDSPK